MKSIFNNASALTIRGIAVFAIAAVIGLSMTACGGDDEGGDKFNGQTLKSGAPSTSTLNTYKISGITFDDLIDAARAANDPDYKGYYEYTINEGGMKMKNLIFVWYNKTEDNYDNMCEYLETELDLYWMPGLEEYMSMGQSEIPEGTMQMSGGFYDTEDITSDFFVCSVQYYLKKYKDVPKDTLAVGFTVATISY